MYVFILERENSMSYIEGIKGYDETKKFVDSLPNLTVEERRLLLLALMMA